MVIGIGVYKFELNLSSDGSIEPDFQLKRYNFHENYKNLNLNDLISINDLFSIYYNHTAGIMIGFEKNQKKAYKLIAGRLKEAPFRIITSFNESFDDSQYLTITLFNLNEDVEIFEGILETSSKHLQKLYNKIAQGNVKNMMFVNSVFDEIEKELQFANFQIDRLSNLTKLQKVGLIYSNPERMKAIELLRKGPISRSKLFEELNKLSDNLNIDLALRPFTDLNIIRRDWAKGTKNKKTAIVSGRGEYIFLIKDVVLVRKPPTGIINRMKENKFIGEKYLEVLNNFYRAYDPLEDYHEENKVLANFILNPDIYDLLVLLSNRSYMRAKIPKVISPYSDSEKIVKDLINAKLIATIKTDENDDDNDAWLCLLAEITPLLIFPDYLITEIQNRYENKDNLSVDMTLFEPLTSEVARRALRILETTYNEDVEFYSRPNKKRRRNKDEEQYQNL